MLNDVFDEALKLGALLIAIFLDHLADRFSHNLVLPLSDRVFNLHRVGVSGTAYSTP